MRTDTILQIVDDVILGKEDTVRRFDEIAMKHGQDPEHFRASIYQVRDAMVKQAEDAVRSLGAEPEAVWAFAQSHYPMDYLMEAQRKHYIDGNLEGYREMARAYLMRNPKQS